MFRLTKFLVALTVIVMSVAGLAPAAAQDGGVRRIPITGQIFVAKLSPDGTTLAVAESGSMHSDEVFPDLLPIRLIDLESGAETLLTGQTDYASDIAWSPDGATLASYHGGGYLSLWDVASGMERKRIPALIGKSRLAYLPDGHTIAASIGGVFPQILWWDTDTGGITAVFSRRFASYSDVMDSTSGVADGLAAFAVMPDGSGIVVATMYGNIWRWDAGSDLPSVLVASEDTLPNLNIRFVTVTADNTVVYLDTRDDPMIRFINAVSGAEITAIPANTRAQPAVSPDGRRVAWLDTDTGDLMLWDADQPDAPVTVDLPELPGRMAPILYGAVAFLPGAGQALISGFVNLDTTDNEVWIVDLP